MKQAQVTDFFSAARKNVKRSSKISSKISPQVTVETTNSSPKPRSVRKAVKRLPSDGGKSTPKTQKPPAFKRFCHLLPPDSKSVPTDVPLPSPSGASPCPEKNAMSEELRPEASALLERLVSHVSPDKSKSPNTSRPTSPVKSLLAERLAKGPGMSPNKSLSPMKSLLAKGPSSPKPRSGAALFAERIAQVGAAPVPASPDKGKRPAFERFAHLLPDRPAAEVPSEEPLPSLPLPPAHQLLLDAFKTMDNVSCMLMARKELLSFERLQESVQKVIRRDFTTRSMGQVLRVYPNSYSLRYVKNVPKFGKRSSAKFELVANVELKGDGTAMSEAADTSHAFNATRLVQRRMLFSSKLLRLVLEKHRAFLCETLGLAPSDLPPHSSLRRWHPRFPLDQVALPEPIPLPLRPEESEQRLTSAQEAVALFRARGMAREAAAAERALQKLAERGPAAGPPAECRQEPPKEPAKEKLKGVSQKLLDKIRAKEAAKAAVLLVRGGAKWRQRQEMVSRLPNLATHVWNLFATSRKPALPLVYLCEKIADSHPSGLSPGTVQDHLKMLAELLPDWLELLPWTTPHARLRDLKRSLTQVRAFLSEKLQEAPPVDS